MSDYSSGTTVRSYNVLSFYKETRLSRQTTKIAEMCTESVQFPKGEKVYRKCTVSALMDTLSVHLNGDGKKRKSWSTFRISIETAIMNHAMCVESVLAAGSN